MRYLGLCLALAGCGSPSLSQYYDAFCDWSVRCGGATSEIAANCRSAIERELASSASGYSLGDAISSGRIVIDEGALGGCVDAVRKADCTQLPITTSCENVYSGGIATGDTCRNPIECNNGYCATASGAQITATGCSGTCRPFPAPGEPCGNIPCARTDFCNTTTKVCERRRGVGQPCTGVTACESGLACIGASSTTPGTCRGPGAEGEPCTSFIGSTCAPGLYCASATPRVCRARVGIGEACTSSAACPDGTACVASADGSARCGSFLDAGQSCVSSANAGVSGCRAGLKCDGVSKTCVNSLLHEGDACTTTCNSSDDLFGDALYCDAASKTCKRRPRLGEPCAVPMGQSDSCVSPTKCDPGTLVCALVCA